MIWWACTALALLGAVLNAQRRIEGFYLWVVANVGFIVKASLVSDWSQVVLWAAYTVITLNGIRVWWAKEKKVPRVQSCDLPKHPNCRCVIVPIKERDE